MNKNEECDIVKDLSALYIDNIISSKSKEFVDKHMENCDDCKKYFESMNSEILEKENREKESDTLELNHLKKVKKRMTNLKILLTAIIVFIILLLFTFYLKMSYIGKITGNAMQKVIELQKLNNYKFTHITINKYNDAEENWEDENVYYYKDGKYKEERRNHIAFYEDNSRERINIFDDLKQIDCVSEYAINQEKGDVLERLKPRIYNVQMMLGRLNVFVRTETYNEKECYVLRVGNSENYSECYISKDDYMLLRTVSKIPKQYSEEVFKFEENVVTDADIDKKILDNEKYKEYKINEIEQSTTDEMRMYYDMLFNI